MFKFIKEFDKKYSTLFFCLSLLVIIVFLAVSVSNKENDNICVMPNTIVDNYVNYLYNVTYISDNKNVQLSIKRFDKKYLVEKNDNGEKSSYYIYYTDILEKSSTGDYIIFRKDNIIEGVDNKLLLLDYINDISLQSGISKENELTCYVNRKLEISICINLDDTIELKGNDYKILYEVKETGTVNDFNVKVNLDYIENTNEELVDSNEQY